MPNDDIELTRRKVLAGLGTVGVASAGVGMGTTAYFSDEETFKNNLLVGSEMDLNLDWEEHVFDETVEGGTLAADPASADYLLPALEPAARLQNGTYPEDGRVGSLRVSSPDDARPVALTIDNRDEFMQSTAVEAFPDPDDNGLQGSQDDDFDYDPCNHGADLPSDLDPHNSLRSATSDTIGSTENGEDGVIYPLINLEDVKPGDFGELTLSLHLCDNDAYLWLAGELRENAENGVTEPEAKDPNEDDGNGVADPDAGDETSGELLDHVLARLWYDEDCDNEVDEETGELDMMIAIDTSGSITGEQRTQMIDGVNAFIDELPTDGSVRVGTLTFGDNDLRALQGLSVPDSISVSGLSFGGNTPLPAAIDVADQVVRDSGRGARTSAQKTVVVFTDGGPNYENVSYGVDGYVAPRDDTANWSTIAGDNSYDSADVASATVSKGEMDETALVAGSVRGQGTRIATVFVGAPDSTEAMTQDAIDTYGTLPDYLGSEIASPGFGFTVAFTDLETLATQLEQSIVVGEEVFFIGTLGQALDRLTDGMGIPLDGDRTTPFEEITGDPDDPNRDCFRAGSTECIGLEWWLPLNHANQIQTDSVSFDLGFYSEQCQSNDGIAEEGDTTEPI